MMDVIEPWRLVVLLFFMGGLVGLWFWSNKGKMQMSNLLSTKESKIIIQDRRWLNTKESLVLVEVEGEKFILVTGQGGSAWQRLEAKDHLEKIID